MGQRPHYKLDAWLQAMELTRQIYRITRSFPREELYGLTSQIRRAAVSVVSNLAEGAARTTKKEFAQFVSVARGSLSELETQLLIARDLGYCQDDEILKLVDRLASLLTGLYRHLVR